jgi:cell division protein FtsB
VSTRQTILLAIAILALFSFLFLILFGDKGLADLKSLQSELKDLIEKNEAIEQENRSFRREIDRLRYDTEYIENLARQELGVIGKDELIIKPESSSEP